jgi:hypothetical protein
VVEEKNMKKVWTYRSGMDIVATPVTRGRRPKPGVFSDARTYGVAHSKDGALADLAQKLGIGTSQFEVVAF